MFLCVCEGNINVLTKTATKGASITEERYIRVCRINKQQ